MPDQSNQPAQIPLAPSELKQHLLDQINTNQEAIEELSDEELENVAGGLSLSREWKWSISIAISIGLSVTL